MLTILIRTVIIYVFLLIIMRLMGKRQIGELELSDLVTTFLLSEIASLPITDTGIPIAFALIPMVVLLTFEVCSSWVLSIFPCLKNIFSAHPSTLISNGKIIKKEMRRARLSLDELMAQLRQSGISDISEVRYAILEQNGKITIIQNAETKPPSAKDLNIRVEDTGMEHIIISEGFINKHSLKRLRISKAELSCILAKENISQKQIYLMLMDDSGKIKIFKKEEN